MFFDGNKSILIYIPLFTCLSFSYFLQDFSKNGPYYEFNLVFKASSGMKEEKMYQL